jgi:hypothetical protein
MNYTMMPNTHHKKENGVLVGGLGGVSSSNWSDHLRLHSVDGSGHRNPFALVLVQQNFQLPANLD